MGTNIFLLNIATVTSKLKSRSNKRRYVVKFGPRRETMKEIIEAEQKKRDPINLSDFVLTEPMKEVLCLCNFCSHFHSTNCHALVPNP